MKINLAVLPGDGIGPEIMEQVINVLNRLGDIYCLDINFKEYPFGGSAVSAGYDILPQKTIWGCLESDGVLVGPVEEQVNSYQVKKNKYKTGLYKLKKMLDLYADIQSFTVYKELANGYLLKEKMANQFTNLWLVKEISNPLDNNIYGNGLNVGKTNGSYIQDYKAIEIQNIIKLAFSLAQNNNNLVGLFKSRNIGSPYLWHEVSKTTALDHPTIDFSEMSLEELIDGLVVNPDLPNVIVTPALFGEILNGMSKIFVSSSALVPTISLGKRQMALCETSQYYAPSLVGQDLANPIGIILSAALMLRFSFNKIKEAESIESAVKSVIAAGYRTADIAGPDAKLIGCKEMGSLIADHLQ